MNEHEYAIDNKSNNDGKLLNYVLNNNVFIFDSLNPNSCAKLIGDLTVLVQLAHENKDEEKKSINFFFNSPGGNISILLSIQYLMDMAKGYNILIPTNVCGRASSAASLLAIQGTPGHRMMGEYTQHFVHFGQTSQAVSKESEIAKTTAQFKRHRDIIKKIYLRHTKIKENQLNKLIEDEMGYLDANACLRLGFCDSILLSDGKTKTR